MWLNEAVSQLSHMYLPDHKIDHFCCRKCHWHIFVPLSCQISSSCFFEDYEAKQIRKKAKAIKIVGETVAPFMALAIYVCNDMIKDS
jgi:hypothetical protein